MSFSRLSMLPIALGLALTGAACGGSSDAAPAAATPTTNAGASSAKPSGSDVTPAPNYAALARDEFNRLAVRYDLPLFWVADKNKNGAVDPDEVVSLLFYGTRNDVGENKTPRWVQGGAFTPAFDAAFAKLLRGEPAMPSGLSPAELERRKLVGEDLDQGYTTLVRSDLTGLSPEDKSFVRHVFAAAEMIDTLYLTQKGVLSLSKDVPADDPSSLALFYRNRGPECVGSKTEKNPACNAIPARATRAPVDVYPRDLQSQPKFCEMLEKQPNAKKLLDPFVVVRASQDGRGKLEPVPYSDAYKELMTGIAGELRAAAAALEDPKESALKAYVTAAAQSFTDDNWLPADEAWSKMNAQN
ncbi:MAG TPA: hypothetical protein VNO21_21005, partial [Polyangiaceae bacterium]|nr:hypothetical protein [Polyangiaceae bacterium]